MYTAYSDFYTEKCKFGSRLDLPVRDKENRRFNRADAHFRTHTEHNTRTKVIVRMSCSLYHKARF